MREKQAYFVYENWRAEGHKARVHRDNCPSCNYGKGVHPGSSEEHGCWHGPFGTLKEALAVAQNSGGVMSFCKRCEPQS